MQMNSNSLNSGQQHQISIQSQQNNQLSIDQNNTMGNYQFSVSNGPLAIQTNFNGDTGPREANGGEDLAFFSPSHLMVQQRMRTDSIGQSLKLQTQLGGATQMQQQMIFGEQSPFYSYLGPQAQFFNPVETSSSQHPSSQSHQYQTQQFSSLQNMEPFSNQQISYSAASVVHSNLPSHKGSFHTDDSLTGSPQQQQPTMNIPAPQTGHTSTIGFESAVSIFRKQSTLQRSAYCNTFGGGGTNTASAACNEFGGTNTAARSKMLREGSISNSVWMGAFRGGDNQIHPDEEMTFADTQLDSVKLPSIQINIQSLQITITTNIKNLSLTQVKDDENLDQSQVSPDQQSIAMKVSNSIFDESSPQIDPPPQYPYRRVKTQSSNQLLILQPQNLQFQEEKHASTIMDNNNYLLTQSLTNSNIGSNQMGFQQNQQTHQQPQQQQAAQEQYQTLSLEQTIWSPQIPPQTQQEFLLSQSQIVQQQQQQQQRLQEMNPQAPVFIPPSSSQAQQQQQQPQQQPQQQQPYQQAFEMMSNQPGVYHGFVGQNNELSQPQQQHQHMVGQQQINPDQQQINDMQQMAALINHQNMINHQISAIQFQQLLPQSIQASVNQNQQMNISHHLQGPPGLSQQDLNQAQAEAQVEAIQQLMTANQVNNPQQILIQQQQQQFELEQQQQKQYQLQIGGNAVSSIQRPQQIQQPTPIYNQNAQLMQPHPNDPINLHHFDQFSQITHMYGNRQINRYMENPIYKLKSLKFSTQSSFRNNSQSPDLSISNSMRVLRPPPGFEHIVPKLNNQIYIGGQFEQQIQQNALQAIQQIQREQQAAANQAVQQQIQQQIMQQQQMAMINQGGNQQQQQYQWNNQIQQANNNMYNQFPMNDNCMSMIYNSFFGEQIRGKQSELDEQIRKTAQQLDHKLLEDLELQEQWTDDQNTYNQQDEDGNINNQVVGSQIWIQVPNMNGTNNIPLVSQGVPNDQVHQFINSHQQQQNNHENKSQGLQSILNLPPYDTQSSVDLGSSSSSSYSKDDAIKHRLNQGVSINSQSQTQTRINNIQVEQEPTQKVLNNGTNTQASFLSNKESKESKERIELYNKLRNQLNKIKNELFSSSDQQVNPKLSPFRLDPSKYLEKILNLMTIINEVESNTNMVELKSECEKTKSQLEKMRGERQKLYCDLSQMTMQYHELENNYQKQVAENQSSREQHMKEREQLDVLIKMSNDQIRQLSEAKESLQTKVNELNLEIETKLKNDIIAKVGGPIGQSDSEKVKQIKQEYGKKLTDYQVQINDLQEYIRKRSQEDQQKRIEDKKVFDNEIQAMKEGYEKVIRLSEQGIRDREAEIRILQEHILTMNPEFFSNNSQVHGVIQIRECTECKKKDARNQDLENRVKDLTDYIKKKREVSGPDRSKLDEEIQNLKNQIVELERKGSKGELQFSQAFMDKLSLIIDKVALRIKAPHYQENDKEQQTEFEFKELHQSLIDLQSFSKISFKCTSSDLSKTEKEQQLMEKLGIRNSEINESYKEIMKEGRNERKLCHQLVIEVEKLMYKMNTLLITEQLNIEEDLKNNKLDSKSILLSRQDSNNKLRELFGKTLDFYLELPLKLKPIYDRMKQYESTVSKLYKADPALLYDLSSSVIEQYKGKYEQVLEQLRILEDRYNESRIAYQKQQEESEIQKQKIISLNEKIVQLNSAYNALQKHLSQKPTSFYNQLTSQMADYRTQAFKGDQLQNNTNSGTNGQQK